MAEQERRRLEPGTDEYRAALAEIRAAEDEARQAREAGGDPWPLWEKVGELRRRHGIVEEPPPDMVDDEG